MISGPLSGDSDVTTLECVQPGYHHGRGDRSELRGAVGGTKYLSAANKLRLGKLLFQLGRHWRDLNYEDASGVAEIDTDTVETLAARILVEEHRVYAEAIGVMLEGRWSLSGRRLLRLA